MIVGVGIDVVDVARFGATLERTPAQVKADAEARLAVIDGLADRAKELLRPGHTADDLTAAADLLRPGQPGPAAPLKAAASVLLEARKPASRRPASGD